MKWGLKKTFSKEEDQAAQELKILEEDVAAARDFIRNNRKNYFQDKKNIPIYLILGPSRFGKSTILSQAGLDVISTDLQKMGKVTPTKYCSFWFTKEAVYIDTAGTYTKPDITTPRNDLIWQGFIKLLQKYFGKDSINGILIVLDLPAVIEDNNLLKSTLFCVRERIYEMINLVKTLNTHIVFTKCDRISGFTEFFSILSPEERLQPFGISFANSKKSELIPIFENKFNQLIKNLHNLVIERLQKATHQEERTLIKTFPSQLSHIRQTLIEVISQIPHSNQIIVSGMYFTSSIQTGTTVDPIKAALFKALSLTPKKAYPLEANNNKSYFVEDIFKKAIDLPKTQSKPFIKFNWLQKEHSYAAAIIAIIITISSIVGYKSYQKNIDIIEQTKYSLSAIEEPKEIYSTIKKFEQNPNSLWLTFGVDNSKKLYRSLTKTHQIIFIQNVANQLEDYLTKLTLSPTPADHQKLYYGLKTYLMLGNPKKINPSYVKSWLNNYWRNIYGDSQKASDLKQQLATALQHKFKIQLNQSLINNLRNNLQSLPAPQLTYLLIETSFSKKTNKIGTFETISKIYLAKNFHKVYQTSIPNIIANLPKQDWVLGKLNIDSFNNKDKSTKKLQHIYIQRYIATWLNLLKSETKIPKKNITEIVQYLNSASSESSQLLNILRQIKLNIQIENPPIEFLKEANNKIPRIDKINLKKIEENLRTLTDYLQPIARDYNPEQKSFSIVVNILDNRSQNPLATFRNLALEQPDWLKQELINIAERTWETLLEATYVNIAQNWNQQVVPQYNTLLANKYPIFENSKTDIELKDFNRFFGTRGIMDNFYNQYLKPFVNADKTKWTWKVIDGQAINFPSDLLEIFLRTAMIQKMFYINNKSEPKLGFALIPQEMTPNTISFNLNIDGQKISFDKENIRTEQLIWPGPKPGSVTMSFVNNQGKYFSSKEEGTWAWFRVLDKSNVTLSNNTRRFKLTFDLNGNAAKYLLIAAQSINPFISEIINNFRCQEISLNK